MCDWSYMTKCGNKLTLVIYIKENLEIAAQRYSQSMPIIGICLNFMPHALPPSHGTEYIELPLHSQC